MRLSLSKRKNFGLTQKVFQLNANKNQTKDKPYKVLNNFSDRSIKHTNSKSKNILPNIKPNELEISKDKKNDKPLKIISYSVKHYSNLNYRPLPPPLNLSGSTSNYVNYINTSGNKHKSTYYYSIQHRNNGTLVEEILKLRKDIFEIIESTNSLFII